MAFWNKTSFSVFFELWTQNFFSIHPSQWKENEITSKYEFNIGKFLIIVRRKKIWVHLWNKMTMHHVLVWGIICIMCFFCTSNFVQHKLLLADGVLMFGNHPPRRCVTTGWNWGVDPRGSGGSCIGGDVYEVYRLQGSGIRGWLEDHAV